MKTDVLDTIYRVLIIISFIFSVFFTTMMIGHSAYLLIERIFNKEQSSKRWELIEEKFEHKLLVIPNTLEYPTE